MLQSVRERIHGSVFGGMRHGLWRAGVRVRNIFSFAGSEDEAAVAALRAERDALIIENARLKDAVQENARLQALLHFSEETKTRIVVTRIIGGSTLLDERLLEVRAGKMDGVLPGDAVVANGGVVIGKVRDVTDRTARVALVTDPRTRFAVTTLRDDELSVAGMSEGWHGTGMLMRLIPANAVIVVGDRVMTSGLEPGVPRGLVLGTVSSISEEPHEPFRTATLTPLIPLDTLTVVSILQVPR